MTVGLPGRPGATPPIGGPVIDLGSTDDVATIAINRPLGTTLAAVRMWRFGDSDQPERVPLAEVPPPWPTSHFHVLARRDGRLPVGTVLAWRPGLYRLDLLVDPADRIQSLLLIVREGLEPLPNDPTQPDQATVDLALVGRLPTAATLWSYSTYLTGWAERFPPDDCLVADIWRSTDLRDPCHAIPVGRPQALGVNLPDGAVVTSIRVQELDPVPGRINGTIQTDVIGRPGLAYFSTAPSVLPDGIHRLDVESSSGSFRWYVEADSRLVEWGL
jgi:hypothetical protein